MSTISDISLKMIKMIDMFIATKNQNNRTVELWLRHCSKNISLINKAVKSSQSVGEKLCLESILARMICQQVTLTRRRSVIGAGVRKESDKKIEWRDLKSAFRNRVRTGVIVNIKHKDPIIFLEDCANPIIIRIKNTLKKYPHLKISSTFNGIFKKCGIDEELEDQKQRITKSSAVDVNTNLSEWFADNILLNILEWLEEFQERDSGWALSEILNLKIQINTYSPITSGSYIELPMDIKKKGVCINVKNRDDACFAWAIVSALYPAKNHSDRPSSYPDYNRVLNLNGISFPIKIKDIKKFEGQNNVSVNIYVLHAHRSKFNKMQFDCRTARLAPNKLERHVNLLLVQDKYYVDVEEEEGDNNQGPVKYHYVWIKNLNGLIRNSSKSKTKFICDRCMNYFYSQDRLTKHSEECSKKNSCKIVFPTEGKISFTNYKFKEKVPMIIYADIESLLVPMVDNNESNTKKCHKHEAYSIGFYCKCSFDDSVSFYRSYRGNNCSKWFAQELVKLGIYLDNLFQNPMKMDKLNNNEWASFRTATICHICEKPFDSNNEKSEKVRDHDHLTGKYRGAAHSGCNLNYQNTKVLPIVFHNLSNYDLHFIVKELCQDIDGGIDIIPENVEKYISVMKKINGSNIQLRFLDSFRFMSASLEKLASYLSIYPTVAKQFPNDVDVNYLTRKGIFPYEYVDSLEKLEEKYLPAKDKFYSSLTDSSINDADYVHAEAVWNHFKIKNLGEYSDLYMKTDILLLTDVFESFRSSCLEHYKLDPAHYFTCPSLSWDAMLKFTKIELDYIHDVDMLMFFEAGIRGGLTQCSKRYSKANNRYMNADYVSDQPEKYLMYYDINAMYTHAMCQPLPYGDLKWCTSEIDIMKVKNDSSIGYVLEVDLEYPEALHDLHSDLPLAPEKMRPPGSKQEKMLAHLHNKINYILHYKNLQYYVNHGMRITKIHRVLQFRQSCWLKPYMDLNTHLRQNAKNEFEKQLFKLCCNAVFGKTMQNQRKHRNIKLKTKWDGRYGVNSYIASPHFHHCHIFDEDFVAVEVTKSQVYMNKPIYIGMSILDISKINLYEFHYDYMKKQYGNNCSALYTDTDSLIYEIFTEDIYKDMKSNASLFDTSDFPENNPYGIIKLNKKVTGLMKDENSGRIMQEFVGLRAKMYACKVDGKNDTKKAKGVKSSVVCTKIDFSDYVNTLFNRLTLVHEQFSFRSYNHKVYTVKQQKISLSSLDDKRYICKDNINTLAWGHYLLNNIADN